MKNKNSKPKLTCISVAAFFLFVHSANAADAKKIESCEYDTRTLSEMAKDLAGTLKDGFSKVPKDVLIENGFPKMVTTKPTKYYKLPNEQNNLISAGLGEAYRFIPLCEVTSLHGIRWLVEGGLTLSYIPEVDTDTNKHYNDLGRIQSQFPMSWSLLPDIENAPSPDSDRKNDDNKQ